MCATRLVTHRTHLTGHWITVAAVAAMAKTWRVAVNGPSESCVMEVIRVDVDVAASVRITA